MMGLTSGSSRTDPREEICMLTWGQSSWGSGAWGGTSVPAFDAVGLAVLLAISVAVAALVLYRRSRAERREATR